MPPERSLTDNRGVVRERWTWASSRSSSFRKASMGSVSASTRSALSLLVTKDSGSGTGSGWEFGEFGRSVKVAVIVAAFILVRSPVRSALAASSRRRRSLRGT
eukprot:Protomagalhaensia_wolfi_Nauph_80__3228@NODE_328_length_2774_cov_8_118464_g247_i0_p5_GENE_NODE_328_length_2774_cov_8_118464_g247_i0NODE_328_length_2774_cov_8_118464_g247_i0_p5_ORF_typecomplete_len103_score0_61_NODE_328_length_2774_cov_8_118464_g247_i016591967